MQAPNRYSSTSTVPQQQHLAAAACTLQRHLAAPARAPETFLIHPILEIKTQKASLSGDLRQQRTQIQTNLCHPALDGISTRPQRPHWHRHLAATPAATQAPKFHSAHRTLRAAPCSGILLRRQHPAHTSSSTLQRHPPAGQLASAHATQTAAPSSSTLQGRQHACFRTHISNSSCILEVRTALASLSREKHGMSPSETPALEASQLHWETCQEHTNQQLDTQHSGQGAFCEHLRTVELDCSLVKGIGKTAIPAIPKNSATRLKNIK